MNRREFIRTAIATATLTAVGAAGLFETAMKAAANQASAQRQAQQLPPVGAQISGGSSGASTQATASSSAGSAPAGYVLVARLSSLSGRSSAYFNHPSHGSSILLDLNGQWRAFSSICTHRVCTLEFQSSELYCPCHGATFSASDGSVTQGPARSTLAEYGVIEQNGSILVSEAVIN